MYAQKYSERIHSKAGKLADGRKNTYCLISLYFSIVNHVNVLPTQNIFFTKSKMKAPIRWKQKEDMNPDFIYPGVFKLVHHSPFYFFRNSKPKPHNVKSLRFCSWCRTFSTRVIHSPDQKATPDIWLKNHF